jgi:hypothetical protein
MKVFRKVSYVLILLFFVSGSNGVNAQDRYSRVQVEIGTGIFTSANEWLAPSMPINIELKTQKGVFDFALKYQKSVAGFGVDNPKTSLFPNNKVLSATLSPNDPDNLNRLKHFESIQAIGNVHLNFEYFKPVIGFGFSLNRFRSYKQKVFRTNQPTEVFLVSPPVFYGWLIRMGHKIDRMRFYVEYHHNNQEGLRPILHLGTAVNFGLTGRTEKEVRFYKPDYSESRFENLIFRIEFSGGLMASLDAEKFSGAQFLGADMHLRLVGDHFVGFGAAFITRYAGYDRGTQDRIDGKDLLLTNATDQTRFLTGYYLYNYQLTISKAFYFGGGIGLYTIPGELRPLPDDTRRLILPYEFETRQYLGANIFAGLRSGLLSNSIRLHFPAGDIPVILEYKLGLGLNFHK